MDGSPLNIATDSASSLLNASTSSRSDDRVPPIQPDGVAPLQYVLIKAVLQRSFCLASRRPLSSEDFQQGGREKDSIHHLLEAAHISLTHWAHVLPAKKYVHYL